MPWLTVTAYDRRDVVTDEVREWYPNAQDASDEYQIAVDDATRSSGSDATETNLFSDYKRTVVVHKDMTSTVIVLEG